MVCVAQFTQAQTIHAILCGATNVSDIGSGCQSSLKLMENALTYVGSQTGMEVDFTLLSGSDFRKDNIMETIADLKVGDDDVIFFYSTSHGFNYNDNPSKFTFIGAHPNKIEMTRSELENFGLSLEMEVYRPLMNKNARLTITMAEACNTVVDIPAPSTYNAMNINIQKRLKELFLEAKGSAISTSSRVDQRSWTDPKDGGIYTNMFIESLNEVIGSKNKAEWDDVFNKTESLTMAYAENENLRGGQRPDTETNFHDTPIEVKKDIDEHDYVAPSIKVVKEENEEENDDDEN